MGVATVVAKTIQLAEANLPESVLEFSRNQGIVEYVERAIKLAREVFADAELISVSLKKDPEFGYAYVDIHAVVHDDPESEAERYSACAVKWASLMPADVAGKIHLSTSWAA